MMFEMPENIKILDDAGIQKLQDKLDVNISIKPKQRQANKSVLIKAQVRFFGTSKVEWSTRTRRSISISRLFFSK